MQEQMKQEKLLIENVRENECLYNNKIESYKDARLKASTWKRISKTLNKSAPECKSMWNALRNAFSHAISRRKQAEQGKQFMKWKYEEEMAFLFPFLEMRGPKRKRKTFSEENTDESNNDDSQTTSFISPKKEIYLQVEDEQPADSSDEETHRSSYTLRKIIKMSEGQNKESSITPQQIQYMDEIDLFFASVAKSVKKLPLVEQVHLKNSIVRMVGDAEIRQVEQNQNNMISLSQHASDMRDKGAMSTKTQNHDPLY